MFQEQREQQSGQQLHELLSALIEIYRAILETNRILTDNISNKLSNLQTTLTNIAQGVSSSVQLLSSINSSLQSTSQRLRQQSHVTVPAQQIQPVARQTQVPTVVPQPIQPAQSPTPSPAMQALIQHLALERQKQELAIAFREHLLRELSKFRKFQFPPGDISISRVVIPPGIQEIQPGLSVSGISRRFNIELEQGKVIPVQAIVSAVSGEQGLRSFYLVPDISRPGTAKQLQYLFTPERILSDLLTLYSSNLKKTDAKTILSQLRPRGVPFTFTSQQFDIAQQNIIRDILSGRELIDDQALRAVFTGQPTPEQYLRLVVASLLATLPRQHLPRALSEHIQSIRTTLGLALSKVVPKGFRRKIRQAATHGEPPEVEYIAKSVTFGEYHAISDAIDSILSRSRDAVHPIYTADDVRKLEDSIKKIPDLPEGYSYIVTKKVLSNLLNISPYHRHGQPTEELERLIQFIESIRQHVTQSKSARTRTAEYAHIQLLRNILTAHSTQPLPLDLHRALELSTQQFSYLARILTDIKRTVPGARGKRISLKRLRDVLPQILSEFEKSVTTGAAPSLEDIAAGLTRSIIPSGAEQSAYQFVLKRIQDIYTVISQADILQVPTLLSILQTGRVQLPKVTEAQLEHVFAAVRAGDVDDAIKRLAAQDNVLPFLETFAPQGVLAALGITPGQIQRVEPGILSQVLQHYGVSLSQYLQSGGEIPGVSKEDFLRKLKLALESNLPPPPQPPKPPTVVPPTESPPGQQPPPVQQNIVNITCDTATINSASATLNVPSLTLTAQNITIAGQPVNLQCANVTIAAQNLQSTLPPASQQPVPSPSNVIQQGVTDQTQITQPEVVVLPLHTLGQSSQTTGVPTGSGGPTGSGTGPGVPTGSGGPPGSGTGPGVPTDTGWPTGPGGPSGPVLPPTPGVPPNPLPAVPPPMTLPPEAWQMLYEAAVRYQFPHLLRERRPETQTLESIRAAATHVLPIIRYTFGTHLLHEYKRELHAIPVRSKHIHKIAEYLSASSVFFTHSIFRQAHEDVTEAQLQLIQSILQQDWVRLLQDVGILTQRQHGKFYELGQDFVNAIQSAQSYEDLRQAVLNMISQPLGLDALSQEAQPIVKEALKDFVDFILLSIKYTFSNIPLPTQLYAKSLLEYVLNPQSGVAKEILKTQDVRDMHKALAGFAYSIFNIGQFFPTAIRRLFSAMSAYMVPILSPAFGAPISLARLEREQVEKAIEYLSMFSRSLFYSSLSVIGFSKAINRVAQSFPFHQVGYAIAYPTRIYADLEFFSRNIDKMIEYNQRMNELYAQRLEAREIGYDIITRMSVTLETALTAITRVVTTFLSVTHLKSLTTPLISSGLLALAGTTGLAVLLSKLGKPLPMSTLVPIGLGIMGGAFAAQYSESLLDILLSGATWYLATLNIQRMARTGLKDAWAKGRLATIGQIAPVAAAVLSAPLQAHGYPATATLLNTFALAFSLMARPGVTIPPTLGYAAGIAALASTITTATLESLNLNRLAINIAQSISLGTITAVIIRSIWSSGTIYAIIIGIAVALGYALLSWYRQPETDPMKIAEQIQFPK